jgi:predicted transcriptional regulator
VLLENEVNQDRHRTAQIVAAYLRRNPLPTDQLASLVSTVHEALGNLGKAPELVAERTPAVSIRRSVQRDVVVCLDCGWRGHTLRRHLMTRHGLNPTDYRARWNLRPEHQLTAPEYSERRSAMAKQFGLGRGRPPVEATESPAPEQNAARSRPRRQRRARAKAA